MSTVPPDTRPTKKLRYPLLKEPAVLAPHPELEGQTAIVPLEPGRRLQGPRGPYVITEVRDVDGVTEISRVAVVDQ